jgi:hypothetical protein
MVSSVLNVGEEELLASLQRMRREYADDAEYAALRADLPADWPI